jgi:site-specific DNA recombinase
MISERIKDKISRSRQKGKYMGGQPVLGYDVVDKKLIINENEKYQIEKIFEFYINGQSISNITDTINKYGWTTKSWTTQKGKLSGGKIFTKQVLYTILKNPIYIGKVRYHGQIFEGEHDGIISKTNFEKVGNLLSKNRTTSKETDHTRTPSMLRGILHCSSCGSIMVKIYTKRKIKKYFYYKCLNAIKNGRHKCSNKPIPASKIDEFVVSHVKKISSDPKFLKTFIQEFSKQRKGDIENINFEVKGLEIKLSSFQSERDKFKLSDDMDSLMQSQEQIHIIVNRLDYLKSKKEILESANINEGNISATISQFFPAWDKLTSDEQNKILDKLFEQIIWSSETKCIDFHYSTLGIQQLQNRGLNYDYNPAD